MLAYLLTFLLTFLLSLQVSKLLTSSQKHVPYCREWKTPPRAPHIHALEHNQNSHKMYRCATRRPKFNPYCDVTAGKLQLASYMSGGCAAARVLRRIRESVHEHPVGKQRLCSCEDSSVPAKVGVSVHVVHADASVPVMPMRKSEGGMVKGE
jgi:hypothetical protein